MPFWDLQLAVLSESALSRWHAAGQWGKFTSQTSQKMNVTGKYKGLGSWNEFWESNIIRIAERILECYNPYLSVFFFLK